ncbi:MAG TPA: hypothetical protein VFU89_05345 [Rhabdochlamydiaceae bacterium]|nr:hypothetical protein [Rhabdochlamydiaceae bacterium]
MSNKADFNPKIAPTFNAPSSAASEFPLIGTSTVTSGVVSSAALDRGKKASDEAMQDLQRQQTRPAAAPALSHDRVSIIDNFNSSSSSAAAPSLPDFDYPWTFPEVEQMLMTTIVFVQSNRLLSGTQLKESVNVGPTLANTLAPVIKCLNRFFEFLLAQSINPGNWIDRVSQTSFLDIMHPFGTSSFLIEHLDQDKVVAPYLDQSLITKWKKNYEQSVLMLQEQKLDRYNETQFPFSELNKTGLSEMKKVMQNQPTRELIEQKAVDFAENPDIALSKLQTENPLLAAELRTAMNGNRYGAIVEPQLQSTISFFKELEQVLQKHPKDTPAIETWLKEHTFKPMYQNPFYIWKKLSKFSSIIPSTENELRLKIALLLITSKSCCDRLNDLGLQSYLNACPSKKDINEYRQVALQQKDHLLINISCSLPIFRTLSAELKKLNLVTTEAEANRKTIAGWMTAYQNFEYFYLFVFCDQLSEFGSALDGVIFLEQLAEFKELYTFCRDRLTTLGLI